jgi:hypothetical protein
MDAQVDQMLGRTDTDRGAERAVQIRRNQQKERANLQGDIAKAQAEIAKLNEERAPVAKELRKVEAEVGPIKYIAALIYGDQADQNLLEKAVRWVIIVIVLVFDPLAVILLLASQYSFNWFRQQEEEPQEEKPIEEPIPQDEMASDIYELETEPEVNEPPYKHMLWPFPSAWQREENIFDVIKHNEKVQEAPLQPGYEDVAIKDDAGMEETPVVVEEKDPVDQWNEMISEAEKAVEEEKEKEDHEILESAAETEKQAMHAWKQDHPESSLKFQKKLFEKGAIDELPWENYLKPRADFSDDDAAAEAAKWAMEQVEKKKSEEEKITWMEHDEEGNQIIKTKDGYTQNAEQSESTIWQRIQDAKK